MHENYIASTSEEFAKRNCQGFTIITTISLVLLLSVASPTRADMKSSLWILCFQFIYYDRLPTIIPASAVEKSVRGEGLYIILAVHNQLLSGRACRRWPITRAGE